MWTKLWTSILDAVDYILENAKVDVTFERNFIQEET